MKLSEVAQKLDCRLEGDPQVEITGVAGMDHALPGQVTFFANRRGTLPVFTPRPSSRDPPRSGPAPTSARTALSMKKSP